MSSPPDSFERWLENKVSKVGRHSLRLLTQSDEPRKTVLRRLRNIVEAHYVDPETTAKRLAQLGAPKTAALLQEHFPTKKKARSGDFGEILATEVAERYLGYSVPIRRLQWKDGRDLALRGDDIIGIIQTKRGPLRFLKGESKSRASLSTAVLQEAGTALNSHRGRPTRHSVLFIAERLRERNEDELALKIEEAVLASFVGSRVEHMLFAVAGSNPENLLRKHLVKNEKRKRLRHAVGIHIKDHGNFIQELFEGF